MHKKKLFAVYVGGFLLAVHYAAIVYVNSSLLGEFVSDSVLNFLYIAGSLLSLTVLLSAPVFMQKRGVRATLTLATTLEILAVFGISVSTTPFFIISAFLVQLAVLPLIYLCLDLNLEHVTRSESTTGNKRGLFLTFQNLAWVATPLSLSFLITSGNLSSAYLLSSVALSPLLIICWLSFPKLDNIERARIHLASGLKTLFRGGDKARIIGIQFMLNFFYSWMIIYLPLLLTKEVGFSWERLGLLFTIMLLPFLLFELPAGILSDKKLGEKEFLIGGFIVMSFTTLIIPLLHTLSFFVWAAVLFTTRVGAALTEIASETYFFKQVKSDDTALISVFRMARPFSMIVAPLIALPIVYFFSYSTSFYFLSGFTLFGLFFIPRVDTR